jgi:hypothetical protein
MLFRRFLTAKTQIEAKRAQALLGGGLDRIATQHKKVTEILLMARGN